jgi:hypothetical protein
MEIDSQGAEFVYRRREPEREVLHRALVEHLETFLEGIQTADFGLPWHVERELRDYVKCGVLANGFVRIRYRLAYDSKLLSAVLRTFLRVVQGWYRKRGRELGLAECRGGSVTFAQRFGSALNLNPHLHTLALDGVFSRSNVFHAAPPLEDEDVKTIVETTARRVIRLLERRGVLDPGDYDELADQEPALAGMTAASIMGLVSTGDPKSGDSVQPTLRIALTDLRIALTDHVTSSSGQTRSRFLPGKSLSPFLHDLPQLPPGVLRLTRPRRSPCRRGSATGSAPAARGCGVRRASSPRSPGCAPAGLPSRCGRRARGAWR